MASRGTDNGRCQDRRTSGVHLDPLRRPLPVHNGCGNEALAFISVFRFSIEEPGDD